MSFFQKTTTVSILCIAVLVGIVYLIFKSKKDNSSPKEGSEEASNE